MALILYGAVGFFVLVYAVGAVGLGWIAGGIAALALAGAGLAAWLQMCERRMAAPEQIPETACARCWHWNGDLGEPRGDCHLMPPTGQARWPEVAAWDQCSHFTPDPARAATEPVPGARPRLVYDRRNDA